MCLGIPGQVVEIVDRDEHRAIAEVDGVRREISIALFSLDDEEPVELGDWVLIHVGFAMSKIDAEEAAETLRALQSLGEAFETERTEFGAGGEIDPLDVPAFAPDVPADPP